MLPTDVIEFQTILVGEDDHASHRGKRARVRIRRFVRALETLVSLAALTQCGTQSAQPAPSAPTKARGAVIAWNDWSPSAAIETCGAAVDEARRAPPELEKARELMVTCSALVGGTQCRAITERQWGSEPTPTFLDAVTVCAKEYCPHLLDASRLDACRVDAADPAFDAAKAWVPLRQSMLIHDFAESDLPGAARAMLAATEYVRAVPPPSFSASDSSRPELEVHLKPDGALTVVRDGQELVTVTSPEELSKVMPQPASDSRVALRAGSEVPHERVVAVMTALKSLGYQHLSFAVTR
jgi:biopolymer transport protein ExbD